jgi:hypothetical protein
MTKAHSTLPMLTSGVFVPGDMVHDVLDIPPPIHAKTVFDSQKMSRVITMTCPNCGRQFPMGLDSVTELKNELCYKCLGLKVK